MRIAKIGIVLIILVILSNLSTNVVFAQCEGQQDGLGGGVGCGVANQCVNIGGAYIYCGTCDANGNQSCIVWPGSCGTCGTSAPPSSYQCGSRQPQVSINGSPYSTTNPQYVSFGDTVSVQTSPISGTGVRLISASGQVGAQSCEPAILSRTIDEWWGTPGQDMTAGAYDYQGECWIGAECEGTITLRINACIAPTAPTLLTPADGGQKDPNEALYWQAPSSWGANCRLFKYKLYISDTLTFSGTPTATLDDAITSYYFAGTPGQTYYWKVRANNYLDGPDSSVWSFVVHPRPWFQSVAGSLFGAGGITSVISSSLPAADQRLILDDAAIGDTGLAFTNTGSIGLGTSTDAKVSDSELNASGTGYSEGDADYGYFKQKMATFDMTAWDGSGKPLYDGGVNNYQIYTHTGDTTINWSPAVGERVIYLINGSVTVSGNITIPTSSPTFMMVAANGSITFNTAVTRVDGWWVGRSLSFPCVDTSPADGSCDNTDVQFVGQGSFIGYDSISFKRDQDLVNMAQPAEQFVYRPDLMVNAPEPLYVSKYIWRYQ